jgi:hypothetical protein
MKSVAKAVSFILYLAAMGMALYGGWVMCGFIWREFGTLFLIGSLLIAPISIIAWPLYMGFAQGIWIVAQILGVVLILSAISGVVETFSE